MNEPIAFINVEKRTLEWACPMRWETPTVVLTDKIPLYTKREWVGLTDEEIKNIVDCGRPDLVNIKKAEQLLKEKNDC
jgi:hypothetical protein